jgi:argininosuccinate synthase
MDENLAHCSYEAGILEDPDTTPPADMWKLTQDPLSAPDQPEDFTLTFEKGVPVKLEYTQGGQKKTATDSVELFLTANAIARRHGVGRIDIVSFMVHSVDSTSLTQDRSRTVSSVSSPVAATRPPVSPACAPPTCK